MLEKTDKVKAIIKRAKSLLDRCTIHYTGNVPDEWDISDYQAVELANMLEEAIELLRKKRESGY